MSNLECGLWAMTIAVGALLLTCVTLAYANVCQEDNSCWNWRTMGNHKRGITTTGGRSIVVGPIRFDRLNNAHRIDWKSTPRLRGDNR